MPFKFHSDERGFINYLLLPLAGVFYILSSIRKYLYHFKIFKSYKSEKPVIIVGNITVGGTGKTPIVIEIVKYLQAKGKKVGVISRGYGRKNKNLVIIDNHTSVKDCGDEPMLIYQQTRAKITVSSSKVEAVKKIENNVDIIISDDGLQHYGLQRDAEVIVFNGFSNGFYIPAGGLREGKKRLKTTDIVIKNEDKAIIPTCFINSKTGEKYPLNYFTNQKVIAMCGIANPERFFDTLRGLWVNFENKVFSDHYDFKPEDFNYNRPIITTAKDWVKYKDFDLNNLSNIYYLDIDIKLKDDVYNKIGSYVK